MRVQLLAVGQKMPRWVAEGYQEYARRLNAELQLELREIPLAKRGRNTDIQRAVETEGERLLAAVSARSRVVALDVKGKSWTTEQLASSLQDWLASGRDIALMVGGPDGLSNACLERAEMRWSLSPLTLPHPLVRVVVAEQLYRALSCLRNHPYHRAN